MKERIVHLKQSGELLTDVAGKRWTASALKKTALRIGEAQQRARSLGVRGLLIVSGGGNVPDGFGRGANTRAQFADSALARYADVIGRRSTVDNSIMLAAALAEHGVPYVLFAAPGSAFEEFELGKIVAYDPALVHAAYQKQHVVLMAGGSGKPGQTTDTAVVEYALWQAQAYPSIQSVALKATKFNGVYDADPAKVPSARPYAEIAATTMLADYARFGAVDRRCLELLQEATASGLDVCLQVYGAEYSIVQALENDRLGTIVHSANVASVFA